MYKTAILFGVLLAFAQAYPQNSASSEEDDVDIDLDALGKKLEAFVKAIRNRDFQGVIDLGINIKIVIDMDSIADVLEPIIDHYNKGNKEPLKCLVRAFKKHNLYEPADFFVDYFLSFLDLINDAAHSVAACRRYISPVNIALCLVNATAQYSLDIISLNTILAVKWAELAVAIPGVVLCPFI